MKQMKRLTVLVCAALVAGGAACSKKSDDSSGAPAPAPAPAAPVTTAKKEISATLTKNPDGSTAIDLVLPDITGMNQSHLGLADENRETELRAADGKSLAALKVYNSFGTLVAAQFQMDRNDARLHILTLNPKSGNSNAYEALLTGMSIERNGALARLESTLDQVSSACNFKSRSQSLASLAEFFKSNPGSSLDQYLEAKKVEAKASDTGSCTVYDITVGEDGKLKLRAVPNTNSDRSDSDDEGNGRNRHRNRSHQHPNDDRQHQHSQPQTVPQPQQQVPPAQQQQVPPSQQQTPPSQQEYFPAWDDVPPSQTQNPNQQHQHQQVPQPQQAPPVQQQLPIPQQQAAPEGYHTNWEACYASGYWRTDGNVYCKQKWWTNCSPEEGGKVCKIKAQKSQPAPQKPAPSQQQQEPPSQQQQQAVPVKAEWTTDFNVCYAAGKWKTDGNNYCKKDFWPSCSPDTGAQKCKPRFD